jgi:organic hydroperoxide reductase OsmC/OhrA
MHLISKKILWENSTHKRKVQIYTHKKGFFQTLRINRQIHIEKNDNIPINKLHKHQHL